MEVNGFTFRHQYSGRNNPDTHWKGGWLGYRPGLDVFEKKKSLVPTGIQHPDLPASNLVSIPSVLSHVMGSDIISVWSSGSSTR